MNQSITFILIAYHIIAFGKTSLCAQDDSNWMETYDFVYLDNVLTNAQYDIRYAGENNFVGKVVDGYKVKRLVLTNAAAKALKRAEKKFLSLGYGLKIFDTYRPQRAVDHFKIWANNITDTLTKATFYPHQDKKQLFNLGYISSRSGHTRGSTIDLTLYILDTGVEVDMGGSYDFFGEVSHHSFTKLKKEQLEVRQLLKQVLSDCGFRSYSKEWWHYTLRKEPYPKTYFNHVVE